MNEFKRLIPVLAGIAVTFGSADFAQAQIYSGFGYGPPHHSGFYAGYTPGGYTINSYYGSTLRVAPGYANTYGMSTGYYGIGSLPYGTSYGLGGYTPIIGAPTPIYGTQTTIIRGGPTGGVVQYTHNGNGYTYTPDSNYPTVIQQQPTLGLSRTIVPPSPPPVVIESRSPSSSPTTVTSARGAGMIKLASPKTASGPLTYSLNDRVYTIQPGYAQSFPDDRDWTIRFKRGGEGSEIAQYPLRAGTYTFALGTNGWELQSGAPTNTIDLPPAPLPEGSSSPIPSLSTTPSPVTPNSVTPSLSPPPTPLPPP